MAWILAALKTRLGQAVALVLAVLAGLGLARRKWRSQGRTEAERDARDETQERVEKGRKAVRDGRGNDPADRVRRNKGRWD